MSDPLLDYLAELNQRIRRGCTAHVAASTGRFYYMNHDTKTSSWLPPVESWNPGGTGLPYGWEGAVDKDGRTYYINHVNKTTTYEDPRKDNDEEPPEPRMVELLRDPHVGFGFVAGSEKPVIVRFVTEGGPSEHNLLPGDQILRINGEDVLRAPREHVIDLVRSCKHSVTLTVCQPQVNNTTRKSALLSAAKKAKLKNNPSRVRFAEGVVINGSPLYCPSSMDSCVTFLPNVLKVFLENGQTKSFKYDSTTTVTDVLKSLQEKLSIKCVDHFSLVVEHVKSMRRNKLILLDPQDTLAKIAAWPGAHHLRCVFRVAFVPKDAQELLQKDPVSFEYLYMQSCNDVVQERFAPELKYDIALRLAALHIQQHALSNGTQGKINIKTIERECGLDRFVPISLLETMKRKELRKLLSHFLKQNQFLGGQKQLTALQAKIHYLKIIADLPSYGAKCFYTNLKDSTTETALLVSPKFGISQISSLRSTAQPISLAHIEEVSSIHVAKDDELTFAVEIHLKNPDRDSLVFSLEDREAEELVLLLRGYHRLLADREIPIDWEDSDPWKVESAPSYHGKHLVEEAPWSYPPRTEMLNEGPPLQPADFSNQVSAYVPCEARMLRNNSREQFCQSSTSLSVDHNANETQRMGDFEPPVQRGAFDLHSVVSIELLEDDSGDVGLFEARNREVFRRVTEANRIVADAENYLLDETQRDEEAPVADMGKIRPADSLLLLSQLDRPDPEVPGDNTSESDTDSLSTPNDSPLHSARLRDSPQLRSRNRTDSSFGLHSPDLLPDCQSEDVMELLRRLQSDGDVQLPFAEGTLYLDPDIIDLTMIPPPATPDDEVPPGSLDNPPTPFSDKLTQPFAENCEENQDRDAERTDAGRIVAELDNLCTALSELRARNLLQNSPTLEDVDIDFFIANATVPPPPSASDDLSPYIIPPPPASCTQEQDDVIARFRQASDDMKRIIGLDATTSECHSDAGSDDSSGYETFSSPMVRMHGETSRLAAFGDGRPKAPPRMKKTSDGGCRVTTPQPKTDAEEACHVARSISWSNFPSGGEPVIATSKPPLPPTSPNLEKAKKALKACSGSEVKTSSGSKNVSRFPHAGRMQASPSPGPQIIDRSSVVSGSGCGNIVATNGTNNIHSDTANNNNNNADDQEDDDDDDVMNNEQYVIVSCGDRADVQTLINGYFHVALNGKALNGNSKYTAPIGIGGQLIEDEAFAEEELGGEEQFTAVLDEIQRLVLHLDSFSQNRPDNGNTATDSDKFNTAREALIAESRQFVTASKLFVKGATESSSDVGDHLNSCITLLDRIFAISELVLAEMVTAAQVDSLVEKLKEVAFAYSDTVHAARLTVGKASTNPDMCHLMHQATTLATALTTLMRTLRTFATP